MPQTKKIIKTLEQCDTDRFISLTIAAIMKKQSIEITLDLKFISKQIW